MRTGGGATSLRSLHEDVAPLVRGGNVASLVARGTSLRSSGGATSPRSLREGAAGGQGAAGAVDRGMGGDGGGEKLTAWWGLVLAGVGLIVVGILALLAYSYWGWEGRVESAAVISPLLGAMFIVWGLGRGARQAARRLRARH